MVVGGGGGVRGGKERASGELTRAYVNYVAALGLNNRQDNLSR